jgi:hypothetical protein
VAHRARRPGIQNGPGDPEHQSFLTGGGQVGS